MGAPKFLEATSSSSALAELNLSTFASPTTDHNAMVASSALFDDAGRAAPKVDYTSRATSATTLPLSEYCIPAS